jgi:HAD superfamily hydrolase (TIGR01549 family)
MNSDNELAKRIQNGTIRGIILDFDGTLLDIRESLRTSIEEVFDEKQINYDIETTMQEIGALMEIIQGTPLPKIVLEAFELFKYITSLQSITFLKKLRIATKIFTTYLTYAKEAPFYPEAEEFIRKFRKTYDFFIVSHNQTKNIIPHLEENKVKSVFKGVFGADLLPALKPDPDALNPVFESYKSCNLKEFIMIGDMPSDIQAGRGAGVWTVGVASGVSKKEILAEFEPDLLIDSLDDLKRLIENKNLTNSNSKNNIKIKS